MTERRPDAAAERVRAVFGGKVVAKSISPAKESNAGEDIDDLITRVCYFYPQYTLEEAENLSASQVAALVKQAEKQRAIEFYNMTLISAAPHTKKGALVGKLIKQYKKVTEL